MCYPVQATNWACGCKWRHDNVFPEYFRRRCHKFATKQPGAICPIPSTRLRALTVPAQCPECHVGVMQNQFRHMYAMTKLSAQNILSYQDQIDLLRDDLDGADAHLVEQLEVDLTALQEHVAQCSNTFTKAREAAIKAFLGPLNGRAFAAHQKMMNGMLEASNAWMKGPTARGQVPDYVPATAKPQTETDPTTDAPAKSAPSPPPSYVSLFPHKSTTPFQAVPHPENDHAQDEQDRGSETSDGDTLPHIDLLKRLFRKLTEELWELINVPYPIAPPLFTFNPSQRTYHATNTHLFTPLPTNTSAQIRASRATTLRAQLCSIFEILREELLIARFHRDSMTMISRVSSRFDLETALPMITGLQAGIDTFVDVIYRNRASCGASELLIPLNGTDTSAAHSIRLLPADDVQFPACVAGFPAYVAGQWEVYRSSVTSESWRSMFEVSKWTEDMQALLRWDAGAYVDQALKQYNNSKVKGKGLTEEALRRHNGRRNSLPASLRVSPQPNPSTSFPSATSGQVPRTRMHAREVATRMRHVPAVMSEDYPKVVKAPADIAVPGIYEYIVVHDFDGALPDEGLEDGDIVESQTNV